MSLVGKLHEISFYGFLTAIIAFVNKRTTPSLLAASAFQPIGTHVFFQRIVFFCFVLFIPIAIITAFMTKHGYDGGEPGEGLTFHSNHIFIIMMAHIGEELIGLVMTPFWFIWYCIKRTLSTWKVLDTITYVIEIIFFVIAYFHI